MDSSVCAIETAMLRHYLLDHSPTFRKFDSWDEKVANDSDLDKVYREKTNQSNEAKNQKDESVFFTQYEKILKQIFPEDKTFFENKDVLLVLDICMAPGGFSYAVLSRHKGAEISGITLPPHDGGHILQDKQGPYSLEDYQHRYTVKYLDITKLAAECGVALEAISSLKPMHDFIAETLYENVEFDLVMGDGVVLDFEKKLSSAVKTDASRRLLLSELILGMQHITSGGILMVLLHRLGDWNTAVLLRDFKDFATVRLWKPTTTYNHRSSFYLIAENVQSKSSPALDAVRKWKQEWRVRTLAYVKTTSETPGSQSTPEHLLSNFQKMGLNSALLANSDAIDRTKNATSENEVREFLDTYGTWLRELGEPVWNTQSRGLQRLYDRAKAQAPPPPVTQQPKENVPPSLIRRFGANSWTARGAKSGQAQ